MAADLGVTQSLISKIVRGTQGAGRDFLARLGMQPGICKEWLENGEGEPFTSTLAGTLPVADRILPGAPNSHANLLSGDRHPVAPALDGDTRYWLRLLPSEPLLAVTPLQLRAGDHLLMETETTWTRRVDLLPGRICGVRRAFSGSVTYHATLLHRSTVGEWITEPRFPNAPNAAIDRSTHMSPEVPTNLRPRRKIQYREKGYETGRRPAKAEGTSHGKGAAAGAQLAIENVVAVCVYIARSNPVFLDA
jgi:hypothetical protein